MSRESYVEEVKDSVLDVLEDYLDEEELLNLVQGKLSKEELVEKLVDDLFIDDHVTGNGSGSYFMNRSKAEDRLAHEWEFIGDVMEEGFLGPKTLAQGAEAVDVALRCFVLPEAIDSALDELMEQK